MRKATWMTSVLGAAMFTFATAGAAYACEATEFSSKNGQIYLNAETKLLQENNPAGALAELNKLRNLGPEEINCYEKGAVLRLSAAVKIKQEDHQGAVRDLEEAIRVGAIAGKDVGQTYYNIAQLHLQGENLVAAKEYMLKWLNTGVRPTRDQNWQLAIIHQQLDDFRGALPYAERVLASDGQGATRQTIDFLIFLYDRTGNKAKKAALLERLLVSDPSDRKVWDAIAGEYYQGNQERKAFEVQKAMYLAGLLKTEDELMRIVNFYNRFNAPYEAAKVLEKEINAGRIGNTLEKLELLANLYQVAREYDKAIPIIQRAAQLARDGKMDERLGRSYFELGDHDKAIAALKKALQRGGLKEPGYANVLIGQSYYEKEERANARQAFADAQKFSDGRRGARGWISFMDAEEETARRFTIFEASVKVEGLQNEKKGCERLKVLGENLPETCLTIDDRLEEAKVALKTLQDNA